MDLWQLFWSRNNEDCQPFNFCGGKKFSCTLLLTFSQVVEKSHQTSLVLIEPPELGRVQRLAVDPDYPLARLMLPGEHDHSLGLVLVVSTLKLHPPPRPRSLLTHSSRLGSGSSHFIIVAVCTTSEITLGCQLPTVASFIHWMKFLSSIICCTSLLSQMLGAAAGDGGLFDVGAPGGEDNLCEEVRPGSLSYPGPG